MKTIFFKTRFDKSLTYDILNIKDVEKNIFMKEVQDDSVQVKDHAAMFGNPLGTIYVASVKAEDDPCILADGTTSTGAMENFTIEGNEIVISKIRPFLQAKNNGENNEDLLFIDSEKHPLQNPNAQEIEYWLYLKVQKIKEDMNPDSEEFKEAVEKLNAFTEKVKESTAFTFGKEETDHIMDIDSMINPPKITSLAELDAGGKTGGRFSGANISDFIRSNYPRPTVASSGFQVNEEIWNLLLRNVLRKENTLIFGPTGTGKTELVMLIASITGYNMHTQDMGTVVDASSTLQGVHRIKKGESVFDFSPYAGYIQDPKSIILLDELNRSSLASRNILFPQLDSRRYLPIDSAEETVPRKIFVHEDNAFFATANIGAEYSGTSAIDRAILDRFFPVELDYLTPSQESKVLIQRIGLLKAQADPIVSILDTIRKLVKKEDLSTSVSIRHGLQIASLVKDGWDITRALEAVILPLYSMADSSGAETASVKAIFGSI